MIAAMLVADPLDFESSPEPAMAAMSPVIPSTAREALWKARDLNGLAPWSSSKCPFRRGPPRSLSCPWGGNYQKQAETMNERRGRSKPDRAEEVDSLVLHDEDVVGEAREKLGDQRTSKESAGRRRGMTSTPPPRMMPMSVRLKFRQVSTFSLDSAKSNQGPTRKNGTRPGGRRAP